MVVNTQYEALLEMVLEDSDYFEPRPDRTGVGTYSTFGHQLRYDLEEGFPLITTKRVHFKSIVGELLWLLSGSTNVDDLHKYGVTIWDEWADENGELGPVYGAQWRNWRDSSTDRGIDQITQLVEGLKKDPYGRRHIVSAWNVADIPSMALAPCHAFFQCYVSQGRLSLQIYQRSADLFLGVPFNIASYALLTHMLAEQTDLEPGDLVWTGGDCHIYTNHLDQVRLQLDRDVRPFPTLGLAPASSIFDYTPEHIMLMNYDPHLPIKADVAI